MSQAYYWHRSHRNEDVPSDAVEGGTDQDGSRIYVGRAKHACESIPAKVIPAKRLAFVSHGGKEHLVDFIDVLCGRRVEWVHTSGSNIPPTAVMGGLTSTGEILYIGRVYHNIATTVGKVHPSHGCLYIPFAGQELKFRDYDILIAI